MKFEVKSLVFADTILPVIELSQKNGQKEFVGINKINLFVDKEGIDFSSNNGNASISGRIEPLATDEIDFKFVEEGEVCVDASQLRNALISFHKDDNVEIELKKVDASQELFIRSCVDKEQLQTISCFDTQVDIPQVSSSFDKELTINKEVFTNAVNKVAFAFGYEKERGNGEFLYWVLRAKKDKLRFASGTSGIFAVMDVSGDKIYSSNKEFDIMFLNTHMPLLLNVLNKIKDEEITIKVSDPKTNYQIVVSSELFNIVLTGMNSSIEWINENTVLDKDYPLKVVTKVSDWDYATKGVLATFTPEMRKQGQPHKTIMEIDKNKNIITTKSENQIKSTRKIPILDGVFPVDGNNSYKSATYSDYLAHIASCWNKEGNIQMEFSGDAGKKPIVVYFNAGEKVLDSKTLKRVDITNGAVEKFVMFFVQTSF